jgi:hypothetical protein
MRGVLLGATLLFCSVLVAGCGGSSGGGRLSANDYRTRLAAVSHEADQAQSQVEQGLHAKTVAALRARLETFAAASQKLGNEVAALKPPENATAANAELAKGEQDTAISTRAVLPKLAHLKSVKAALTYLQQSQGNAKGGHELDDSLTKLKQLGYTKGS